MQIKIDKYTLEQEVNAPTTFNLKVKKVSGPKAKVPGEEYEQIIAYGLTLKRAIEVIAAEECLISDEVVTLKEYVTKFNEQLKRFDDLLNK